MFYFNDFPRFFENMCDHEIVQNSCLHGGASIPSLLIEGNAMYPQFCTPNALLGQDGDGNPIYDFGACTVPQLLLGYDDRLHDPGYAVPVNDETNINGTTSSTSTGVMEMSNPCHAEAAYLEYAIETFSSHVTTNPSGHWDYVMINDNTRNPAQAHTRAHALQTIERFYVPWFLETGATPVFLWTHAYTPATEGECSTTTTANSPQNNKRDMTGLEDVANFTSLTRVGYQAYADLLQLYLPRAQHPRIAPVGLAFLVVHEENFETWQRLFHCDGIHASPSGTFLQGCIIYHTLFGTMPDHDFVVRKNMPSLWKRARMMQHVWEPSNPFPDEETAEYLYTVAERVMNEGYVPKSFINYQNGEVAYSAAAAASEKTN